ncbi:MAG: hypothetical protein ACW97A_02935 [Candidatus Thorarchaeota archaeon]|jgi:hypothetical protein
MSHSRRIRILIVIGFVAIIVGGAGMAFGNPGLTNECDICHNTSGVLILTSNATGTVNANLSMPFVLAVDALGYTGGDQDFVISLQEDWADNNAFTFFPAEIQDDGTGDLNAATDEIRAEFSFTPKSAGSFIIRIWTAASGDLATSLDVPVLIEANVNTPPGLNSPADILYYEGFPGHIINWTPMDSNPASYIIWRDDVIIRSRDWNSTNEDIFVDVSGLSLGSYNYRLVVIDTEGYSTYDDVVVNVYSSVYPNLDHPPDLYIVEGTTGNEVLWSPKDNGTRDSYVVYLDGVVEKSGSWNSPFQKIRVTVDGYSIGEYNLTAVVTDGSGNNGSDTVFLYVYDGAAPSIDNPSDIIFSEGDILANITWNPTAQYPSVYEIHKEGIRVRSWDWNSTLETISVKLDNLPLGDHNFSLVVIDAAGNSTTDYVLATAIDSTLPLIDSPTDIEYTEGETGNSITWNPTDDHPETYEVFQNGTSILSEDWLGTAVAVEVDELDVGQHNFSIIVMDVGGNSASDTVIVTVNEVPDLPTTPTTPTTPTIPPTTSGELPPELAQASQIGIVVLGVVIIILVVLLEERIRLR